MGGSTVGGLAAAVGGVCGMQLGCVFCFCFCFSVVVVLVYCCGGSGVIRWWVGCGALMGASNGGGLWVVVGVVGFFILYFYIYFYFVFLYIVGFFNVILILKYIILIYRIEE